MSQTCPVLCTLRLVAQGRVEVCAGERCAFWEPGGAVVGGGCVIDRLGVDVRRRDVAAHLLETRERLEHVRDRAETEAAQSELAQRVGLEL